MTPPPFELPQAPLLIDTNDVAAISWQGSPGASSYNVERAENKNGPWIVVGRNISDADFQYRPLFNDTTAEIGKSYYYRVIAKNSVGLSEHSYAIGPVPVAYKTLVDEMQDWKFINNRDGNLSLQTNQARKFKEDSHRLKGTTGSFIIYKTEGPIISWKVFAFFPDKISDFNFYISADGNNFETAKFTRHDYFSGKGDYSYFPPVLYTGTGSGDAKYLKIEFPPSGKVSPKAFLPSADTAEAQISRVEIKYGAPPFGK
jgi:hypothetical protein